MKATESKTTASQVQTQKEDNKPFFSAEGQGGVFDSATPFFSGAERPNGHFFSSSAPVVQAKLTVGAPDDPYEREADAMADKVVQRLAVSPPDGDRNDEIPPAPLDQPSAVQRKCAACEQEEKEKIREKPENGALEPFIQRKPIFESGNEPAEEMQMPGVQRMCSECAGEQEEEQHISKKSDGSGESVASENVSSRLSAGKGGGSPLSESTRTSMESAFGADFSGVRIHTDSAAVQLSRDLRAQAFTHGSDVYFGAGKFSPGTKEGDTLLAHELTHTIQQGSAVRRKPDPAFAVGKAKSTPLAPVQTPAPVVQKKTEPETELPEEKKGQADVMRMGVAGAPPEEGEEGDGIRRRAEKGVAVQASPGLGHQLQRIDRQIQRREAGQSDRTYLPFSGITLCNPFRYGTIRFVDVPAEILADFAIIPEEHEGDFCQTITPSNDTDYEADGLWWRHNATQWLKVPDSCYLEITYHEGELYMEGCCNLVAMGLVRLRRPYWGTIQWTNDAHACRNPFLASGAAPADSVVRPKLIQRKKVSAPADSGATSKWPPSTPKVGYIQKQAISPGNTGNAASNQARFIVDDTVPPSQGQMRKTDFLRRLNEEVCQSANQAMRGTPFSADSCPYIRNAFARHKNSTPAEIERLLERYEPALRTAQNIEAYFLLFKSKVQQVVNGWLQTGDMSGVPPEIAAQIPESILAAARAMRSVRNIGNTIRSGINTVTSGIGSAISSIGSIFFKEKAGGANATQSPLAVMQNLGQGQAMDGSTRSKMEGAFGTSFSDVEVHTDSNAASLAGSMNARAFAVGNHIAFGAGEHKPGSLAGDALMAHELAHVEQQRGAISKDGILYKDGYTTSAVEHDADHAAIGVMGRILGRGKEVLAEVKSMLRPGMRTGLAVRSCSTEMITDEEVLRNRRAGQPASVSDPSTYTIEQLMYMLDQLSANVENYRLLKTNTETAACAMAEANTPSSGDYNYGQGHNSADLYYSSQGILENSRVLNDAMTNDPLTYPAGLDFDTLELLFLIKFKEKAKQLTLNVLEANELIIREEQTQGLIHDSNGRVASLYQELAPVRAIGEQIEAQTDIKRELIRQGRRYDIPNSGADARINILKAEAIQRIGELSARFPVLADPEVTELVEPPFGLNPNFPNVGRLLKNTNFFNRLLYGDMEDVRYVILTVSRRRLSDIQTTREGINNDPSKVFMLERIVELTKENIGVLPGSIQEAIIQQKLHSIQIETIFRNVAIAALGIGLGIISGGTGFVAGLAALGAAGISAAQLYESVSRYRFESAASGTAYDRAQAVAGEAGSPLWIALDVIGLIGDVTAAVKVTRAIARSAQIARETRASAEAMQELIRDARAAGQVAASEGVVRTAAEVEQMAVEAVQRQLRQESMLADPANASALHAINTAVPGIDDIGRHGLLELPAGLRTKILQNLPQDVIMRIAHSSQSSMGYRRVVQMMQEGLGDTNFFQVMTTLSRQSSGESLIHIMHSSGMSVDDLRRIDFSNVRTANGRWIKFRDHMYQIMGQRLAGDNSGLAGLIQNFGRLHPEQRTAVIRQMLANRPDIPRGLAQEIINSSDLQRVLQNHSFDTRQLTQWWSEFQQSGHSGSFTSFVEPRSGFSFRQTASQTLADFRAAMPNASVLDQHVALLTFSEPRLAAAITNNALPPALGQRLRQLLSDPASIGRATTVTGGRAKIVEAVNETIAQNLRTPQEMQAVMQLVTQPGSRGSIAEHFARYHLLGPAASADNLRHVAFTPEEVPGLTASPFLPDRIRPSGRTLDIKAGYETTAIDIEQARNYQRLFNESRRAGSPVQQRLRALLGEQFSGLSGHDYLFLPGAGGNARQAAERAMRQITENNMNSFMRVTFLDSDGILKELRPIPGNPGSFASFPVGARLPD